MPIDRILGTKGGLVNLGRRRTARDTAQQHPLNLEGVAGAQYRAHIGKTPYIVEHHYKRKLFGSFEFFGGDAVQVPNGLLFHLAGKGS